MPQRAALAWWRDSLSGDCEKTVLRRSRKEADCRRVLTFSVSFSQSPLLEGRGGEGRVVVRWWRRLGCNSVDIF